ncbi:flagellar biosynthesis protein FlhB [Aureimonas pseudogalii]|jgi:flagellar biosynthetic protein FlhB|uniref:Flagellar biosynthetic protein FlhB n=1 Tax=Aureimonas pseudogalii TaxID=1744844 RepID=A0A7W6E808_9HYPH|nr:flagellar biosynthesis protein FlhB [Aureimonas pseudogalii]MBB3996413.1 flagellar biosynthetic protein FlhB [Aureimonas pseudogalii]
MSEGADKESQTEEPTEKKIADTIEKGNLPTSREAPILASLLAAMGVVAFQARENAAELAGNLKVTFENPTQWSIGNSIDALQFLHVVTVQSARFVLPATGLFLIAGVLASLLQNPPQINLERIRPKFSNVSPTQGWGRMFGKRGWTEFGKSLFKFSAVTIIVGWILSSDLPLLLKTMFSDPLLLPETILDLSMRLLAAVSIATIVLVAADLLFSRILWRRDLRMSKQEIKDEMKQSEGDPAIKARQRQIARERNRKRMMAAVPKATVIIANPTHYAIALRYVREEGGAPLVVAKGVDLIALKIREIGEAHDIPIVEDKLLARSMYDHVDVDQMIPPQFFKAVAELIYYLHSRNGSRAEIGAA